MEFSSNLHRLDEVQLVLYVGAPAQRFKVISVRVSSIDSRISRYLNNLISTFYSSANLGSIKLQVAVVENRPDTSNIAFRDELKIKVSRVMAQVSKTELEANPFKAVDLGNYSVRKYIYWVETRELRLEEATTP